MINQPIVAIQLIVTANSVRRATARQIYGSIHLQSQKWLTIGGTDPSQKAKLIFEQYIQTLFNKYLF
jgi:hypothetical protein